mmetsp:Transcript_27296/g.76332  ORF Transcript_27296/g.76332 Transcript_27296/m.76332 type:complete len:388 (-) Transcript_27296:91-1254(-)
MSTNNKMRTKTSARFRKKQQLQRMLQNCARAFALWWNCESSSSCLKNSQNSTMSMSPSLFLSMSKMILSTALGWAFRPHMCSASTSSSTTMKPLLSSSISWKASSSSSVGTFCCAVTSLGSWFLLQKSTRCRCCGGALSEPSEPSPGGPRELASLLPRAATEFIACACSSCVFARLRSARSVRGTYSGGASCGPGIAFVAVCTARTVAAQLKTAARTNTTKPPPPPRPSVWMTRGITVPNSAQREPAAPSMTPRTMTKLFEANRLTNMASAARKEKHVTNMISHCRIITWRHAAGSARVSLSSWEAWQASAHVHSASYVTTSPSAKVPPSRRTVRDIVQTPISNLAVSCWVSMLASPSPLHQSRKLAAMDRAATMRKIWASRAAYAA